MRVIGKKLLVRVVKDKEQPVEKIGNFEIPNYNTSFISGVVISVGNEVESKISEGDEILFPTNCGINAEIEPGIRVIYENDVLVIK